MNKYFLDTMTKKKIYIVTLLFCVPTDFLFKLTTYCRMCLTASSGSALRFYNTHLVEYFLLAFGSEETFREEWVNDSGAK